MIKQHTAILLTLCFIFTQPTHAYTLKWLPYQPAKHSATVGSSESHSDRTQTSRQSSGSQINAGGNLSLVATAEKGEEGREKDKSQGGNLTIQGSDIKAGKDINLEADNKINLLAAQNTADQVSHNSSKSSGTGVGITVGTGGIVGGLNANAAMARGNVDGTDTTNTYTRVNAGNKLTLKSGGDTNLIGATAKGKQISANIGGDLNIQSVQDTSTYQSSQQSASGNATVGVGTVASASGNLNQISINGDYASVTEQNGLMAGDGGFQIAVKGNTDLKGAVIESTDVAVQNNRNTFSTATLTTSDIRNQADYEAQSISVSGGTGGIGAPMALTAGDNDASATRSGISGAMVSITNTDKHKQLTGKDTEQTIASLNRDVSTGKDTSSAIGNNLDVDQVQGAMSVTQTFVQQANTFVAVQAQKSDKLKAAGELKQKEASQETDPARKQQLQAEAQSLNQQAADSKDESAKWQPGGTYRQIATAFTAAAGGNVTGGTNQLIQGAAVNYIQSLGAEQIKAMAPALGGEGSPAHTALHGILACSGAAAQGADCGTAALGASTGVVINSLMAGDPSTMSAAELENRKNLVATLVTGIAAAAGSTEVSSATNAAVIETENNYLSQWQKVAYDKELKACGDAACKLGVSLRWQMTSVNQDAAFVTGMALGVGLDAKDAAAALTELPQTIAMLADNPELLKGLPAGYLQDLQTTYNEYQTALEAAGVDGATAAGVKFTHLLGQVALLPATAATAGVAAGNTVTKMDGLLSKIGKAGDVKVGANAAAIEAGASVSTAAGLKNPSGNISTSANAARNQYYGNGSSASASPGVNAAGSSGASVNGLMSRPDFYVNSQGTILPTTGYRYMDSRFAEQTQSTMTAPLSYFGFTNYATAGEALNGYQINPILFNNDARLKGSFDTLQLFGSNGFVNAKVPLANGGIGPGFEPYTSSYPLLGSGGQAQLVPVNQGTTVKLNNLTVLPE